MDRDIVYFVLILNVILGIRYYIKSGCEIPFILAFFNVLVEYRIFSLKLGYGEFVRFDYGVDIQFNFKIAYEVSNLIVLGTSVLMYCFMLFYKPTTKIINDSDAYLKQYISSKKTVIIFGLIIFSIVQYLLQKSDSGGYGFLIRLGNSSFIILLYMVVISTKIKSFIVKLAYVALFIFMAYLTWSPGLRFQFLGWIIPIGYYLLRNIKPGLKTFYLIIGTFVIMIVFSIARDLGYAKNQNLTFEQNIDAGFSRMLVADDINFIDGFMMMYQIYPKYLDYDYGMEHLDILLRPIPRAIWPGKPLAGWFQVYAAKYKTTSFKIGFSPTIYGVFYAEGGVPGIIIFGIIWAWVLSKLYRSFSGFNSMLKFFLIGVFLSALVPILRSGDLPGDFAIVFMSYWGIIIFVSRYKKFVKKQLKIEQYNRMIVA